MIADVLFVAVIFILYFQSVALSSEDVFQTTDSWKAISLSFIGVSFFMLLAVLKIFSLKRALLKEKCSHEENQALDKKLSSLVGSKEILNGDGEPLGSEDNISNDCGLELEKSLEEYKNYLAEVKQKLIEESKLSKELKDRFVLLEKDLEQSKKLETIGVLAAGISHEINTPMQYITNNVNFFGDMLNDLVDGIVLYKELLFSCTPGKETDIAIEKSKKSDDVIDLSYLETEIPDAIRHTNEGLDSVAKIVNAMKEFSYMGSGERVTTDLNSAIESAITISRNEWKYVAETKIDFDQELPMVSCFPSDIRQAVMNLIINAAHAIGDAIRNGNDEKGLIFITTSFNKSSVIISVADTGTGIPQKNLDKIFKPFFTTKEAGKGTGQGLAMVYNSVVKKHGGKLLCNTKLGKGTEFIIELPIEFSQSNKGIPDHERGNIKQS